MLNPYRETTATEHVERAGAARWDDYILAVLLIGLGTTRVTLAFANGEDFGAEATIAGLMMGLGVLLSISTFARR